MTKEEASQTYGIPTDILDLYASWGLCNTVREVMGVWQYDDVDIERLGMIMTLHDIGFENNEIEEYMRMMMEGQTNPELLQKVNQKRNKTLDEIHFYEKRLERLDFIRHEMKKRQEEK